MNRKLEVGNTIMLFFYGLLFLVAVHNTVRYVLWEKRYQNFHISFFYVLVYLIILLRVIWLSAILNVVNHYSTAKS